MWSARPVVVVVVGLILASVVKGYAGQAPAQADARLQGFLSRLQAAVARGDRQAVAAMAQYPLTVFVEGVRMPVENAAAFVERYNQIVTGSVRTAIESARAAAEGRPASGLRVGSDGVVEIGERVSLTPVGDGLKITRVSLTLAAAKDGGGPAARAAPLRLSFRVGRPTQVSGALAAGQTDRYLARVGQGTLLDVRVERVRGDDIVARIVDAKTGAPIDVKSGSGARVWTGRAPATADYRIEVVRRRQDGEATMPYVLAVSLR